MTNEPDQEELYRRATAYIATGVPAERALGQAYADAIADRNEVLTVLKERAYQQAEDAAWQHLADEIGAVRMLQHRQQSDARRAEENHRENRRLDAARMGLQISEEPDQGKELCPRCGSLLWTSEAPSGGHGVVVNTRFGAVNWGGRDPRQSQLPWSRCSNQDCSFPLPEQSGSGAYSPGVRNFLR